MRLTPGSLPVGAGDRAVWINRDPFPHTVVSTAGAFGSGEITFDQSWVYVVERTGVVPHACSLRPMMKAELRVN